MNNDQKSESLSGSGPYFGQAAFELITTTRLKRLVFRTSNCGERLEYRTLCTYTRAVARFSAYGVAADYLPEWAAGEHAGTAGEQHVKGREGNKPGVSR